MNELRLKVGQHELTLVLSKLEEDAEVALRPLCESMGLSFAAQYRRLLNNPQFNCCSRATVAEDGKNREMVTIPASEVGMFLGTVNARRVKPELFDRLVAFQKSLQVVIHEALTGKVSAAVVERLTRQVEFMATQMQTMASTIERQGEIIERQGARIEQLESENESFEILSRASTRAAAVQLSARRRANLVH